MNPPETPKRSQHVRPYIIAAVALAAVSLCGFGVASRFQLSREPAALREGILQSASGGWEKRIELRAGWLTTGLVRAGSKLFNLAPEPRTVIEAFRTAEVGVYELRREADSPDRVTMLGDADNAMTASGWERIVGVIADGKVVAIYMPRQRPSSTRTRFCLMAIHNRRLVVASVSGNLEALAELATRKFETRRTNERRSGEDRRWSKNTN